MLSGFLLKKLLYLYIMINEYLEDKRVQVEYEKLLAWKQYYLSCWNEWESMKIDRKIQRFREKYFV